MIKSWFLQRRQEAEGHTKRNHILVRALLISSPITRILFMVTRFFTNNTQIGNSTQILKDVVNIWPLSVFIAVLKHPKIIIIFFFKGTYILQIFIYIVVGDQ